jgi:hypothetical protein
MGTPVMNIAIAWACSRRRNHEVKYNRIPG